ncbi:hypothetical protein [Kaistella treverensis]|uniref:hypothetical protein n=1 Tax=Kaistella treverensis TaxID=631455 RepID=UPI001F45A3B0|nr:hypothetical protein [Kaistella treverensis]
MKFASNSFGEAEITVWEVSPKTKILLVLAGKISGMPMNRIEYEKNSAVKRKNLLNRKVRSFSKKRK